MADELSASEQGPGGPPFAVRNTRGDGKNYPMGMPPDANVATDQSGTLESGTITLDPVPTAVHRWVQNKDAGPMAVQLGVGGPKYTIAAAGFGGAPGGLFPPPGHYFLFIGELILTSATNPVAAFDAGWL